MMKYALNILAVLLLAWIIGGGSTGYKTVAPMTPAANLPVWGQKDAVEERARRDVRDGIAVLSAEDAEHKEKVVFLYKLVSREPCNEDARKELASLLVSYLKDLKSSFAGDDEQSRYEHSVRLHLNKQLSDILISSYEDGYLTKSDFPLLARMIVGPFLPDGGKMSACDREKARQAE